MCLATERLLSELVEESQLLQYTEAACPTICLTEIHQRHAGRPPLRPLPPEGPRPGGVLREDGRSGPTGGERQRSHRGASGADVGREGLDAFLTFKL